MSRSDTDYLRHIRDEAAFLERESTAIDRDALLRDEVRKRAFVRSLEIIIASRRFGIFSPGGPFVSLPTLSWLLHLIPLGSPAAARALSSPATTVARPGVRRSATR
jgi:hypothetical protein